MPTPLHTERTWLNLGKEALLRAPPAATDGQPSYSDAAQSKPTNQVHDNPVHQLRKSSAKKHGHRGQCTVMSLAFG